jgi:hypothetical protein
MSYFISKLGILPLVAVASISLFLVVMTQVLPQRGLTQPSSTPLSPNHPDAKLDPNLRNVPAMPERATDRSEIRPTQTPDQEVNYDSLTGTSGVGETKPVKPSVQPTEVNAPNPGTGSK